MTDVKARIIELETRFATIKKSLNLDAVRLDLKKLESQSSDPDLWKDQTHARDLMQRIGDLKKQVEQVETLEKDIDEFIAHARKGDYHMDKMYGNEGLKIIKQYLRILNQKIHHSL